MATGPLKYMCFRRINNQLIETDPDLSQSGLGPRPVFLAPRAAFDDLVDQAEFLGLAGVEVPVAVGLLGDDVDRLAGVMGQDFVQPLPRFRFFSPFSLRSGQMHNPIRISASEPATALSATAEE